VGKTTLSINLAYTLAKLDVKLLLIDTDPQSSVAMSLSKNARSRKGFYDWMNGGESLDHCIMKTKLGMMHVMTAGQYQEYAKQEWSKAILLERLAKLKQELAEMDYDLVMVDTAAGLMDMTELMILYADFLMVPEQVEPLSIRSLPHMMQSLQRIKQVNAAKFKLLGVI
jgi:chromosome partitioning protein